MSSSAGEAGVNYIGGDGTSRSSSTFFTEQDIKISGVELFLMPGLSYRILKKVHMELTIPDIISIQNLTQKTTRNNQTTKQSSTHFLSSLNSNGLNALGIGFRIIL